MKISRYRLTPLGWIGAAMFVLPTPIAAWTLIPPKLKPGEALYEETLRGLGGSLSIYEPPAALLTALATASLVGLVFLLIGREIVTTD